MRKSVLLALLAFGALSQSALAAPAKISPRASSVSATGVATIQAANPNRHVLRGTATVTANGRTLARRTVRLGRRSVAVIRLRFGTEALATLRSVGGRAKVTLRLRDADGRRTTARRTIRLRLPSGAPTDDGEPVPPPAAPERWLGRMGAEGAYDDFELAVADRRIEIAKAPVVPVFCAENGGSFRTALSLELFDVPGPWTIGTDESVSRQSIAVNQLVSSGARPITYKVTGTVHEAERLTGTLGMSFFDSRFDIFNNRIIFINCFGSQSFEAVPER